jgi:glycosyltransferase involved in cell wall biosynthesis
LICCEIGTGTTWVNRHNETGLVVAPCNPEALAHAMNALAHDDDLCMRLGLGARERWKKLFSPSVVGAKYRLMYNELLEIRTQTGVEQTT